MIIRVIIRNIMWLCQCSMQYQEFGNNNNTCLCHGNIDVLLASNPQSLKLSPPDLIVDIKVSSLYILSLSEIWNVSKGTSVCEKRMLKESLYCIMVGGCPLVLMPFDLCLRTRDKSALESLHWCHHFKCFPWVLQYLQECHLHQVHRW